MSVSAATSRTSIFDANKLSAEIISRVMHHMTWKYLNQLWFVAPDVLTTSGQPHPVEQSPLREIIHTLCRVVNEQPERDEQTVYEVMDMTQSLVETLYSNPLDGSYIVPEHFWTTELGQLIMLAQLWARGDELITLSEAAQILRGSVEDRDLVYVNDQIKRGRLTRYTEPDEPNPQRAGRVSRQQVETLKAD